MSTAAQAGTEKEVQTLLSDDLAQILQAADQVGNAAVVMHKGKIIATAHNGLKQIGTDLSVGAEDEWHVGSNGKSMTSTLLGRLADKGEINLDEKIANYAKEQNIDLHPSWAEVKLIDLLTHISGAAANFDEETLSVLSFADQAALQKARVAAVKAVLEAPTDHDYNTKFVYSNIGYTVAGSLVAERLGKTYEELMHEEFFKPLGLKSAEIGAPKGDNPWGHELQENGELVAIAPERPDSDNSHIMAPAGTWHMTMQDLARYINMHAEVDAGLSDFLSPETAKMLHTPPALTSGKENYAAGLAVIQLRTEEPTRSFFHNGSNTLWYAFMLGVPDEQIAITMVTNRGNIAESEAAFFVLAEKVINTIKKAAQ